MNRNPDPLNESGTQKTGPHEVQMESWISCAPFERLLNMTIVKAENGRAVLTMPVLYDFVQGGGLLHGGALISLADTAVAMAIKSMLSPKTHFGTISMESKFLHPVRKGIVTARAQARSLKDRVLEGEATIFDEAQKAVMVFTSIFKVAKDAGIKGVTFKT
ncbi:MAG: PaaI family thioesterase [Deltaproteobacteria bacterium]|nr:PaaI family thioesterase [Deltaproteobacteria bacterium]